MLSPQDMVCGRESAVPGCEKPSPQGAVCRAVRYAKSTGHGVRERERGAGLCEKPSPQGAVCRAV